MAPGNAIGRYGPACCGRVENFVAARHREAHKQKLTGARSLINNSRSVREEMRLQPSRRNVKHEQVQDEKFANIERENMRLLIRMQEIGRREDDRRSDFCGNAASKAAGRIVLGGMPAPQRKVVRCSSLPAMGKGSNSNARMRELRRIDDENQKLMKRLTGAKPTLSNNRMEEQHREQQRVMRLRQENAPKVPGPRVPLPFDQVVPDDLDPEDVRLEGLTAALQRRVQELEKEEGIFEEGEVASAAATPASACSPVDAATCEEREDIIERRDYVGGQMPEHSRLLVEQLMAEEYEHPNTSPPEEDAPEDDGKDAVARILAAADALEAHDPLIGANDHHRFLSYDNVVQRSRAKIQAANRMLEVQT